MKLISMHVDDFGGLHNYDYTFGDGLNVVLHDNGWGKTTMATFLKAMLYGYDTRRSKDITENERKRYLPWQGGAATVAPLTLNQKAYGIVLPVPLAKHHALIR